MGNAMVNADCQWTGLKSDQEMSPASSRVACEDLSREGWLREEGHSDLGCLLFQSWALVFFSPDTVSSGLFVLSFPFWV